MKTLWAFIKAFPELVRLFKTVQANAQKIKTDNTVKENVKLIDDAFKKKDANELKKIFNS